MRGGEVEEDEEGQLNTVPCSRDSVDLCVCVGVCVRRGDSGAGGGGLTYGCLIQSC